MHELCIHYHQHREPMMILHVGLTSNSSAAFPQLSRNIEPIKNYLGAMITVSEHHVSHLYHPPHWKIVDARLIMQLRVVGSPTKWSRSQQWRLIPRLTILWSTSVAQKLPNTRARIRVPERYTYPSQFRYLSGYPGK